MITALKRWIKRALIACIPPRAHVPMFGDLWGTWWTFGSANINNWLARDEKAVQGAFKKWLRPDMVAYDIGANVGFYTLLAARLVGPKGKVFAFEPFAPNFEFLEDHIRVNRLRNAEAHQLAVSDHGGEVLFEAGDSSSTGHLSDRGDVRVRAVSLDEFVAEHKAALPDFVKIDVEGHELGVLNGMRGILDAKRDVVIQVEANEDQKEIFAFLRERGYQIERLDTENVVAVRP